MRTSFYILAATALVAAAPASAQSAFDGTWKVDVATAQLPTKPFGSIILNGTYSCTTCDKPYSVPADGAFHAVVGQPYWDEVSVKVVDANTVVETWKLKGKVVDSATNTVATDGNSVAWTDADTSAPNGRAIVNSGTNLRVTKGPAGSHSLSGTWRPGKPGKIADESLTISFKTVGKAVTMTTPAGYHYTATVGGPAVPVVGDNANTLAEVTMPSSETLVETDSRDGKVVSKMTAAVAPGGRSMKITFYDALRGTTAKYTANKQ